MIDGLPPETPGRFSVGSWLGLLLVVLLGGACGLALYWFLSYAANLGSP